MHNDLTAAPALIATMKAAANIAERSGNAKVRKAAASLRDKAFAQYVWG